MQKRVKFLAFFVLRFAYNTKNTPLSARVIVALSFHMNIESIEIEDPIELHKTAAIEVTIVTSCGEKRWCFFFTPEGMAACGDYIEGTKVRFHYGASHMILVSEISLEIIEAALRNIEKQGKVELCSIPYV